MTLEQPLRRLILGWAIAGGLVVVLAFVVAVLDRAEMPLGLVLLAVILVAVTTVARADLELASRRLAMNPSEIGLLAAFALLEPSVAVLAAATGWLLADGVRRVPAAKLAFNAGVASVGAGFAAVPIWGLGGPVDPTTVSGLLAMVLALVAYGIVGVVAASMLVARMDDAAYRQVVPAVAVVTALTTALAGSLGILAVTVAITAPLVLPVLVLLLALLVVMLRDRMTRIEQEQVEHDRLERVVEGARDGITLLDDAGRIELANPAMLALLGCEDDGIGRSLPDLVARTQASEVVHRALAGSDERGSQAVVEALQALTVAEPQRRIDLDLGDQTVALYLTGTFDRFGRHHGTIVLLVDVTEEHEYAGLREELLARVSHELRTPLTAIVGATETLTRHGSRLDGTDRSELLRVLDRQAGRLGRLVDDLLWTSRVERDLIAPRPMVVTLRAAVAETVAALEPELTHDVEVVVEMDVVVEVDADHLQQILSNLVRNAETYGRPPVRVTATPGEGDLTLSVLDHGEGVPVEFVPRLFDTFAQASLGDRRTSQGLGLGLALTRALVEANHGSIAYRRQEGVTRFEVVLPTPEDVRY